MNSENPRAEFERYNETHKEKPIDPEIANQAKRELLLDELHARASHEQPSKAEIIASIPEGELLKINFADEKIPEAIEALTMARKILIENMSAASDSELLGNSRDTTFAALEETLGTKIGEPKLSEGLKATVEAIQTYMVIDPDTTLYDLPYFIEEFLSLLKRKQAHSDKNVTGNHEGNDPHESYDYE